MPNELTQLVKIPSRDSMNTGINPARQSTMLDLFGSPALRKTRNCQGVSLMAPKLRRHFTTADVGPFNVTGFAPAVADLITIFAKVKKRDPQVYDQIKTAGMLCCRLVRGSDRYWSNHAWGTAIDTYFGTGVDAMGDGRCYVGTLRLYQTGAFRESGWFWGAEFAREDSMHQEAGDDRVRDYARMLGL